MGRDYSGHAFDRMQERGVTPSVVENAIKNGERTLGNQPGTAVNVFEGVKVVANDNGGVITVTRR